LAPLFIGLVGGSRRLWLCNNQEVRLAADLGCRRNEPVAGRSRARGDLSTTLARQWLVQQEL
jgi:hypothetical protein